MTGPGPRRPSVVIAGFNEEAVIGRCLDALLAQPGPAGIDITVVANGCTDATAAVASARPGVRVIERREPGKAAALNAGDAVAEGFPRIYIDADVVLSAGGIHILSAALEQPSSDGTPPLAVVPRRQLDLSGRSLLVRAFFAVNSRLPAYDRALYGRGVIALSAEGRQRFGEFPDVIADDLFLDSLFTPGEKLEVAEAASRVATPRRIADLVRRLVRVRAGNAALRAATPAVDTVMRVRGSASFSWLRDVVLPRPWLAPAATCYVAITLVAGLMARVSPDAQAWRRDTSTRDIASPEIRIR